MRVALASPFVPCEDARVRPVCAVSEQSGMWGPRSTPRCSRAVYVFLVSVKVSSHRACVCHLDYYVETISAGARHDGSRARDPVDGAGEARRSHAPRGRRDAEAEPPRAAGAARTRPFTHRTGHGATADATGPAGVGASAMRLRIPPFVHCGLACLDTPDPTFFALSFAASVPLAGWFSIIPLTVIARRGRQTDPKDGIKALARRTPPASSGTLAEAALLDRNRSAGRGAAASSVGRR